MNPNMASGAAPMAIVAAQRVMRWRTGMMKLPMIFGFTAVNMISPMTGTETTPLITALQQSALIGSILVKPITRPTSVDRAMTP
jgi:hypothetical protein